MQNDTTSAAVREAIAAARLRKESAAQSKLLARLAHPAVFDFPTGFNLFAAAWHAGNSFMNIKFIENITPPDAGLFLAQLSPAFQRMVANDPAVMKADKAELGLRVLEAMNRHHKKQPGYKYKTPKIIVEPWKLFKDDVEREGGVTKIADAALKNFDLAAHLEALRSVRQEHIETAHWLSENLRIKVPEEDMDSFFSARAMYDSLYDEKTRYPLRDPFLVARAFQLRQHTRDITDMSPLRKAAMGIVYDLISVDKGVAGFPAWLDKPAKISTVSALECLWDALPEHAQNSTGSSQSIRPSNETFVRNVMRRVDELGLPIVSLTHLAADAGLTEDELAPLFTAHNPSQLCWYTGSNGCKPLHAFRLLAKYLDMEPAQLLPAPGDIKTQAKNAAVIIGGTVDPKDGWDGFRASQGIFAEKFNTAEDVIGAALKLLPDDVDASRAQPLLRNALANPKQAIRKDGLPSLPHFWLAKTQHGVALDDEDTAILSFCDFWKIDLPDTAPGTLSLGFAAMRVASAAPEAIVDYNDFAGFVAGGEEKRVKVLDRMFDTLKAALAAHETDAANVAQKKTVAPLMNDTHKKTLMPLVRMAAAHAVQSPLFTALRSDPAYQTAVLQSRHFA